MSDLISRSELLKEIEKYKFGAISNDTEREYIKNTILNFINFQPTAYDIDKVVEELELIRAKKTCNKEKCDTKEICRICVVDDAIEIVKQGSVSDDVCEWKDKELYGYYTSCTEFRSCIACKDKYWKYCPYCGKKIKVVE